MAVIEIDDSRYPLVRVTFEGRVADHVFDRYLETMSRVLRRSMKNALVFDARLARSPTAMQRSKQVAWLKANRETIQKYSCGSAFVVASTVIRGALTAVLWVAPIPGAHVVVATLPEAEGWAIARLTAEGVALPPAKPVIRA